MDLFQNLGVSIVNYYSDVVINKGENLKKVKECLVKDSEIVYLLEIKNLGIGEVSQEKYNRFHEFVINPLPNFLKLKYVVEKEQIVFFYAYEKIGSRMTDYLEFNELSIKKKLFIYKQAIEVVLSLVYIYKDESLEFNENFFYIQEKENLVNDKIPLLKIIYDGKFNNLLLGGLFPREKINKGEIDENCYYWLLKFHSIIFKNFINLPCEELKDELEILREYIYGLICNEEAVMMIKFESIINYFNSILRRVGLEEISEAFTNQIYGILNTNMNYMKPNSNLISLSSNLPNQSMNYMPANTPLSLNINNNFNNSQINYNQYFQFFNGNPNFSMPAQGNFNFDHSKNMNSNQSQSQNLSNLLQNINFLNTPESKGNTYANLMRNMQVDQNMLINMYMNHYKMNYRVLDGGLGLNECSSNFYNTGNINNPMNCNNYYQFPGGINNTGNMSNIYGMNNFNYDNSNINKINAFNHFLNNTMIDNIQPFNSNIDNYSMNANTFFMKEGKEFEKYAKLDNNMNSINGINNINTINNFNSINNFNNLPNCSNPNLKNIFFDDMFNDKNNSFVDKPSNISKNNKNIKSESKIIKTKTSPIKIQKKEEALNSEYIIKESENSNIKVNIEKDSDNNERCITIVFDKKLIPDLKIYNSSSKTDSGSVCSEEDKELMLKRKKRRKDITPKEKHENLVNKPLKSESKRDKKKKLRIITTKQINSVDIINIDPNEWDDKLNEDQIINQLHNIATPSKMTLTCSTFNEKDLEMINKIDNPRRKKLKNNEKNNFFSNEKSPLIKSEIINFIPKFEEELERTLESKAHCFMKINFPLMYNIENFYLYIKLNRERKENKTGVIYLESLNKSEIAIESESIVKEIDCQVKIDEYHMKMNDGSLNEKNEVSKVNLLNQLNKDPINSKACDIFLKIWDCNKINPDKVDEYLFNIEKHWPIDKFVWCQESALLLLANTEYNIEKSINDIKKRSQRFIQFIKERKLEKNEYKKNLDALNMENGKSSKRIQL